MTPVECQTDDHLIESYMAEKEKKLKGEKDESNFLEQTLNSKKRKNNGVREPTAGMKKL